MWKSSLFGNTENCKDVFNAFSDPGLARKNRTTPDQFHFFSFMPKFFSSLWQIALAEKLDKHNFIREWRMTTSDGLGARKLGLKFLEEMGL